MKTLSKKLSIALAGLLTTLCLVPLAQAEIYIGAKGGQLQNGDAEGVEFEPAIAYGGYVGYSNNGIGMELEYVDSEDADVDFKTSNGVTIQGTTSTQSLGVYSVYRYHVANGPIYAKGKLGMSFNNYDMSATAQNSYSSESKSAEETTSGLAYGLGLGIQPMENFAIEAEYNKISAEDALISVGTHLAF